jgi:hypothetical protein
MTALQATGCIAAALLGVWTILLVAQVLKRFIVNHPGDRAVKTESRRHAPSRVGNESRQREVHSTIPEWPFSHIVVALALRPIRELRSDR